MHVFNSSVANPPLFLLSVTSFVAPYYVTEVNKPNLKGLFTSVPLVETPTSFLPIVLNPPQFALVNVLLSSVLPFRHVCHPFPALLTGGSRTLTRQVGPACFIPSHPQIDPIPTPAAASFSDQPQIDSNP